MKFYPYEKGEGTENVLAMLKKGGVVYTQYLQVLAILKGVAQKVSTLLKREGGLHNIVLYLEGGGAQKVSYLRFSHFVVPPSP